GCLCDRHAAELREPRAWQPRGVRGGHARHAIAISEGGVAGIAANPACSLLRTAACRGAGDARHARDPTERYAYITQSVIKLQIKCLKDSSDRRGPRSPQYDADQTARSLLEAGSKVPMEALHGRPGNTTAIRLRLSNLTRELGSLSSRLPAK